MKKTFIPSLLLGGALTALAMNVMPMALAQDIGTPVPPLPALPAPAPQPAPAPAEPVATAATVTMPAPSGMAIAAPMGQYSYTFDSYGGYSGEDNESELSSLQKRIADEEQEIQRLTTLRDDASRKYTSEQIARTTQKIEMLRSYCDRLRKLAARLTRISPLQKKVDVKFDNATVAQAAEALSKASGVPITAEDAIPDTTRLTVEARRVRLATVLESVARQANLIIEPGDGFDKPEGSLSVILTMPPMLRVNDSVQKFSVPSSPWSAKWGTPPTRRFYVDATGTDWGDSQQALTLYRSIFPAISGSATAIAKSAPGVRVETNRAIAEALRSAGMTPVAGQYQLRTTNGDKRIVIMQSDGTQKINVSKDGTITIEETGKNKKGESGTWKSVYTLKDGELKQKSRDFIKN